MMWTRNCITTRTLFKRHRRIDSLDIANTPRPSGVGTWASYVAEHWHRSLYLRDSLVVQYTACEDCLNAVAHPLMTHLPRGWPEEKDCELGCYERLQTDNFVDPDR